MARKYARATGLPGGVVSCPSRSLSRHLEKRASLRGCHVSLLLPASFTIERQVEHDLLLVGEQVVQSIDLGSGVREAPAPAHHTMEVVVMLRVEGDQHRDDRVPRVGAPGHDQVAADVATEPIVRCATGGHLFSVHRRRGRYRRGIEDARVLRERRDHQIDVHRPRVSAPRRLAPDSTSTSSHTPKRSASNCSSRPGWPARHKSRSKTRRQLVGCRQRHELAAILESAALNDPVKHLGLQSRDDVREVRRVQNAIEQTTRVSGVRAPAGRFAAPRRRWAAGESPTPSRADDEDDERIFHRPPCSNPIA